MAYEELYGVLSSAEFARFMVKKHVANKVTLSFVLLLLFFYNYCCCFFKHRDKKIRGSLSNLQALSFVINKS